MIRVILVIGECESRWRRFDGQVHLGSRVVAEGGTLAQATRLFDESGSTEALLVLAHGTQAAILTRTTDTRATPLLDHLFAVRLTIK